MRRHSKRLPGKKAASYAVALVGCFLTAKTALAEVTIIKGQNNWDVYLGGRIGAFFSYTTGDGYPVPIAPSTTLVAGGGLDEANLDRVVETDAMGMPDITKQGTISKMRVRSGMMPNIITLGARKHWQGGLTFRSQISIWGTIEPDSPLNNPRLAKGQLPRPSGPDEGVSADVREGFVEIDGSFGTVTAGRILTLFSRGNFENDFLYGHGYGVGFPGVRTQPQAGGQEVAGGLSRPGPTGGMAGFGSLGPGYGAALVYTTPSLSGIKISAGIYDPVQLYSTAWNTTRVPRPEGEIAYDFVSSNFKLHLFGEGAWQKLYDTTDNVNTDMYGASFGGRFEAGPVRVGVSGFTGKGVGLYYAFDASATSASKALEPDGSTKNELRTFRGYSGLVQIALGQIDIGGGIGQTQVPLTEADKADTSGASIIKTQTGITAAVVYHVTDQLHLDVDYFNASFEWRGGEKQKVNILNAGTTFTF